MSKKNVFIISFVLSLVLACSSLASAADYVSFNKDFKGGPGLPSSIACSDQTVTTYGSNLRYASANCSYYIYGGNQPVLTVQCITNGYRTQSCSFTSVGNGTMDYWGNAPTVYNKIQFRGYISNGSSYTIRASVKG